MSTSRIAIPPCFQCVFWLPHNHHNHGVWRGSMVLTFHPGCGGTHHSMHACFFVILQLFVSVSTHHRRKSHMRIRVPVSLYPFIITTHVCSSLRHMCVLATLYPLNNITMHACPCTFLYSSGVSTFVHMDSCWMNEYANACDINVCILLMYVARM
jgi:hypothetical protein